MSINNIYIPLANNYNTNVHKLSDVHKIIIYASLACFTGIVMRVFMREVFEKIFVTVFIQQ